MKLPQMIRNLWIYRRLLGLAMLLGVVLYFVGANWSDVQVVFPFIGTVNSRVGVVMLVSGLLGAAVTWLTMTFRRAIEDARREGASRAEPAAKEAVPKRTNGIASRPEREEQASLLPPPGGEG